MADIIDIKSRKKKKPEGIPEECYLRFSTPDKDGFGPYYAEWSGVSPGMLLAAEAIIGDLKEVLLDIIQGGEEDDPDG